jgi:uncharacterized damage-inducible protein DinB
MPTRVTPTMQELLRPYVATRDQLLDRLDGLTDDEYHWDPVTGGWSVRRTDSGWSADWADPDPVPAPVTTIAWRLWHVAVDALDAYSARAFGTSGTDLTGRSWVGTAREALPLTRSAFDNFQAGVEAMGTDRLGERLGDAWGPAYADASHLDLFLHALRETTHHAAEIGLLRDLYAAHPAP